MTNNRPLRIDLAADMRARFGLEDPKPGERAHGPQAVQTADRGRSWFTALAGGDGTAEVLIYDEIGLWGITAADFDRDLKALGEVSQISLRINSPGGDVFDGIAIFNMLRHHRARVNVTIDGVAASMASVIAMAGDEIAMPDNSFMMIHDPSGVVVGTSGDMRELADALDKVKESLVSAYAGKSGLSRDRVSQIMAAETWLTAEEAVELGFADRVDRPVRMAANFRQLARFQSVPDRLTASGATPDSGSRTNGGSGLLEMAQAMNSTASAPTDTPQRDTGEIVSRNSGNRTNEGSGLLPMAQARNSTELRVDLAEDMRQRLAARAWPPVEG